MKKVTVSAPGKLHLSGEHAVVYGKPALVVSTSLRLFVTLTSKPAKIMLSAARGKDAYIHSVISEFEKRTGSVVAGDISLTIDSSIPVGSGMGSSAALAVALAGALSAWHGLPWNTRLINEIAYQAEKTKHANSSGSDPAISTNGGIIWFRKELEFLKTLWLLTLKIPKSFRPFVLINTGRAESTGELVTHVASVRKRDPVRFAVLLTAIEDATKRAAQMIHDENEEGFRQVVRENERLLEEMEIVSPSASALIKDIEAVSGSAKISGAGGKRSGSGVVIALHDTPEELVRLAKEHGYPAFQVMLGGEGVKLENIVV